MFFNVFFQFWFFSSWCLIYFLSLHVCCLNWSSCPDCIHYLAFTWLDDWLIVSNESVQTVFKLSTEVFIMSYSSFTSWHQTNRFLEDLHRSWYKRFNSIPLLHDLQRVSMPWIKISRLFELIFWIFLPSVFLHFGSHLFCFSGITQSMIVVVWCCPSPPLPKNLGWPCGTGNISQRRTLCVQQTPSAALGMWSSRGSVRSPTGRFMRCIMSLCSSIDSDMHACSLRTVQRCECCDTFYTITSDVRREKLGVWQRWRNTLLVSYYST